MSQRQLAATQDEHDGREYQTVGHALAAGVVTIAVLNAVSALSMPVPERKAPAGIVAVWLALLTVHAAIYAVGDRIRGRFTLGTYAGAQAAVLFAIGLAPPPAPLTLVLYTAADAELVTLAGTGAPRFAAIRPSPVPSLWPSMKTGPHRASAATSSAARFASAT